MTDPIPLERDETARKLEEALFEIRRVIAGQEGMLERVLVCLLAGGHLLIEGVPLENPGLFVQRLNRVLNKAV